MLGSLSKFLAKSTPAIDAPLDYCGLTKIYEKARLYRGHRVGVDQEPLHHRHIVNVVIKSRVIRDWQHKDAYLHVYHPDWKQYHLIGLSQRDSSEPSIEVARRVAKRALQTHLRLGPSQYELNRTVNPPVVSLKRISETNGAYTEYTYQVVVVSKIHPKLDRNEQLREDPVERRGPFRWFTWEEIRKERSSQGEVIMFSTPVVMEPLHPEQLTISAPKADDVRQRADILGELGTRFTRVQLSFIVLGFLVLPALALLPRLLLRFSHPNPTLNNLAGVARIVSTVIGFGVPLVSAFFAWVKQSRRL